MIDFDHKHISDPVYKTIGLSKLETEIIDTPVFQRLRHVKHLGLVSLVYPGADFSRFDHSLGVCHITGRILSAVKNANLKILDDDREIQKYRLAGLLHDIGHYPFSHPMEEAIEEFYKQRSVEHRGTEEASDDSATEEIKFIKHEQVGEEILRSDPDLKKIFEKSDYDPDEVSGIFTGSTNSPFGNLVKSDLDADRIDYLLRTAHHTGVPYGSIDVDYLISQMVFDEGEERISLLQRAMRSAEHLLFCRYFVYQQTIFHKTVAGFEYLLRDVLRALLEKELVHFARADIEQAIEKQEWSNFDDVYIEGKIRELRKSPDIEDHLSQKIDSIRTRKPVSLVYEWEVFADRESSGQFADRKMLVDGCVENAITEYGIDKSLWRVWYKRPGITNLASHMKITDKPNVHEILQSVHLYDPDKEENKSEPIMGNTRSLMSVIADHVLYAVRVYVLLPDGEDKECLKLKIREYFEQKLRNP